ncbi:EAL domain-containing protein [Nodosilinea sp. FACHB-131]|uniref:EAL domain-containing protein n=1 Tax=Cyanophyceae TaxID=3028117 RepID=UPI001685CE36|nr:EAL domain-containing protein [Nodosilinea sp. FACHB-131]MBD1871985.1 EAL domain-containing protein [Nodosilinea sp. FACHB-131]
MIPLHFVSNGAIALSYLWIGGVLLLLSSQLYRPGFRLIYWVMAAFILSCGFGHFLEATNNPWAMAWHPVTAVVSLSSAAIISRYRPYLAKVAAADNLNETILDSMAQPLVLVQVEADDLRVAYQNPAAVAGLGRDMTGQLLGEALPSHKTSQGEGRSLLDTYIDVAQRGAVEEFDAYYPGDGIEGWYRVKALPAGPGQALIAWADISDERVSLEAQLFLNEIQRAILEREFVLHYQPIIDLSTGAIAGYEALVRWLGQDGTIRYPDEFLGAIERTALMPALCYLVAELACEELQSWAGTDREGLHMAINLSPLTVGEVDFESRFNSVLDRFVIRRQQLRLEITERDALEEPVIFKVQRLRQIGHGISIDDFGTGVSNIMTLRDYPADQLKIDRSFITNLLTNSQDQDIVKTIVVLAGSFGLEIVAEGVEDAATAQWLGSAGVQYGQGFYWSKAVPLK